MPRSCWLWLLLGYVLAACLQRHEAVTPSVDSETHFLRSCSASCDDGLRCICGVCTAACSGDRECSSYADAARCYEPVADQPQACGAEAPVRVCDVTCTRTADCAPLSAEHVCQLGTCRAPSLEQTPPVKQASSALTYASGGGRLKALHYAADGATQFRGLHDQQLDIDCEFMPDSSGGGFHCVPKTVADVIYLDTECTEPAIAIETPSDSPWLQGNLISVRTTGPAGNCVGEAPVPRDSYRIGARVFEGGLDSLQKPLPTVYARRDGKCAETQLQRRLLPPDVNRLELIDPALLVAGAVSTIDVGGGLALQRLEAQDGTQITLAVLGLDGMPCSLQQDGRCVPEPIAASSRGFYLDGKCAEAGFAIAPNETCDRAPRGVRTIDDTVHVYELVLNESAFVPGADGTGCQQLGPNADVFRAGAEVTDTFPKATRLQTGNGALQVTRFVAPNGESLSAQSMLDPGGTFTDAQGRACSVKEAFDGSLRCLPERSRVNESDYWTDATCSERLYVGADPKAERSELRVVRFQQTSYQTIEALFSLNLHEGTVYQRINTSCVSAEPAPIALLAKGAELSLTTLPSVEATEL